MTTIVYVAAALAVLAVLFWVTRFFSRAYFRYRDSRVIICPDSHEQAVVEVDAVHAALTSAVGQPDIRLRNCWRWPLNQNCGQECLTQLDVAAPDCLVSGVLMRWYDLKQCVYCAKPFERIQWTDHKPALLSPEDKLIEWSEVAIENVQTVMTTYRPVCWDCAVAQSFVRDSPDLAVYRPWREGIHRAGH
ncbi:MAG: hypothetical protein ACRD9S_20045 [Pyrinomonadaceae bacterium]